MIERDFLSVVWAIRKFRPYIEGTLFLVHLYHVSRRWMMILNYPHGLLMRGRLSLATHYF